MTEQNDNGGNVPAYTQFALTERPSEITTDTSAAKPGPVEDVDAGQDHAQEQEYVDPAKVVETLDKENAERHAAEDDQIAPYEAISDPKYLEMAKEYHEDAVAIARDSGIAPQAVEAVLHYVLGAHAEAVERDLQGSLAPGEIPGVPLSNERACFTILQRQFGAMTNEIIRQSGEAFRKLPKDTQAYLTHAEADGSRLSNSPYLTIALALHNGGYTQMTKAQAEKEMANLRAQKSLDALGKAKLAITRHLVSRGKSQDDKKLLASLQKEKAAKPTPTAEGKIRGDLAELRRNPAYFKKDHPAHAEVVRQVVALTARLHPEGSR